jgi:hypothetical protein
MRLYYLAVVMVVVGLMGCNNENKNNDNKWDDLVLDGDSNRVPSSITRDERMIATFHEMKTEPVGLLWIKVLRNKDGKDFWDPYCRFGITRDGMEKLRKTKHVLIVWKDGTRKTLPVSEEKRED